MAAELCLVAKQKIGKAHEAMLEIYSKFFFAVRPEQTSSKGFARVEMCVERVCFRIFLRSYDPFDAAFDAALSRFAQSLLRASG
jgi:hypothetical protein